MIRSVQCLIVCGLCCCGSAYAERPWWVEGSFVSIDLSSLIESPPHSSKSIERLPSILTLIHDIAVERDVDPDLFRALVAQESSYQPRAVSEDGAVGLGQLMPIIASWCGLDNRFHRGGNLHCSARHLRVLLRKYDGNERLALAAYNAGEPAVDRCRCVPNYPETQDYVQRVMLMRLTPFGEQPG